MSRRRRLPALALLLVLPRGASSGERGPTEATPGWSLSGSAGIHYGYYDVQGDATSSPYLFTGAQPYGQVDLTFEAVLADAHLIRAQFLGIVNDSDYRSSDQGFVAERIRLTFENPDFSLPYRAELGDSYAYFSQRTLQRPLKGLRLDLQSTLGAPDRLMSLQLVSGGYDTNWRALRLRDDYTTGLSWLVADPRHGTLNVSFLESSQVGDDGFDRRRRTQRLASIAGWLPARLGELALTLEGEIAHLRENDRVVGDPDDAFHSEDDGYFFQVTGRYRRPLSFRLRFESYGQDYDPVNAPIVSDRRLAEGHLGYRIGGGQVRARVLAYRDFAGSSNPFDTNTVGVRYAGSLGGGVIANVDAFAQELFDREGTTDLGIWTFDGEMSRSFGRSFAPRLRLFWQDRNDRRDAAEIALDGDQSAETFEAHLAAGWSARFLGLVGTVTPGVLVRRIRDGAESSDDWQPTLDVSMRRGPHTLVQRLGYRRQDRRLPDGIDVDTYTWGALYRLRSERHEMAVEVDYDGRDVTVGEETDSWRAAASYAYRFTAGSAVPPTLRYGHAGAAADGWAGDLAALELGAPVAEAIAMVRPLLGPPSRLGRKLTWFTPLFTAVYQSQRFVLLEEDSRLESAALILVPEEIEDPARFEQELERIRRIFVGMYGAPTATLEEGDLAGDVYQRVNRGDLRRVSEWQLADGAVLRFGIPHRLDGQVLMELRLARQLPSIRDTRWSIDDEAR